MSALLTGMGVLLWLGVPLLALTNRTEECTMSYPTTVEEFTLLTEDYKASAHFRAPLLFAIGGRVMSRGSHVSVRYPFVNGPGQNLGTAAVIMKHLRVEPRGVVSVPVSISTLEKLTRYFAPYEGDGRQHVNVDMLKRAQGAEAPVVTFIFDDVEPEGIDDSTLKLYGMSWRHYKPNTLNLTNIFTRLPNVAWVGDNPMTENGVDDALVNAAFGNAPFSPHMVDKFPLYIHRMNAVKMDVRITDQNKVRLGAYLGKGTVLMPGASYINFNAGTEGPAMVEGRISSSAFVGAGSDVGGGASILGTLSGGNAVPVSVGRNCLLEVNSALGIPLGDACVVAANTAVMVSTLVSVHVPGHAMDGAVVKAGMLAGINAVTFRRDSQTGTVDVVRTARNVDAAKHLEDGQTILNKDLHAEH